MMAMTPPVLMPPAGAAWMSCARAWTSWSLIDLTRSRADSGSTPADCNCWITSARSSVPSNRVRSALVDPVVAWSAPIRPACAVWKDSASNETTNTRQVDFLKSSFMDALLEVVWVRVGGGAEARSAIYARRTGRRCSASARRNMFLQVFRQVGAGLAACAQVPSPEARGAQPWNGG